MKAIGWLAAATALAWAIPAAADVRAGVEAWKRGDYGAALKQWRAPAASGDADAQFNMGQAYKLGRGVPVDLAAAEGWFRKAAVQGHVRAGDSYGLALYQAGRRADALPWLEKGAARGEPRTRLVLATMLFNGDGIAADRPRAYALMTLAARAGTPSAAGMLARMEDYVTPADRETAARLAQQMTAVPTPASATPAAAISPAQRPATVAAARPTPAPAAAAGQPAPRPAAAPPAPPRPVATASASAMAPGAVAGGWKVQLGAFRDRGNAEALWARLRTSLAPATPAYVEGGGVTRLQASGFPTRAAATRACAAVDGPCVVLNP